MVSLSLAAELIRNRRGKRSQMALSRRLGYSTNVAYAWESGRRHPSASDFFRVVLRTGGDVTSGLQRFLGRSPAWLAGSATEPRFVAHLLQELRGDRRVASLARTLGISRLTLGRWFEGKTEPRLPELLDYVQAVTLRLVEFVELFCDPDALPSLRHTYRDYRAQLRVAYDLPTSHAVLRALELTAYRKLPTHQPGVLAESIGVTLAEEEECIAALLRAKQIRWNGHHYTPARVLTIDTQIDPTRNLALKRHWAKLAFDRLGKSPGHFSYNLFAVSEDDFDRILALHRRYFEELRAIVSTAERADRVVLANMQLFDLAQAGEPPRGSG